MNTGQIDCFLAVAEYLNFTKAAGSLYMSQAAVTYQIAALEKELGARLFDRTGQKVRLTPCGEALLVWARRLSQDFAEARARVAAAKQDTGGLFSLGIYGDLLFPCLAHLLRAYGAQRPGVQVTVSQHNARELVSALDANDIDLAIMTTYGDFAPKQPWVKTVPLFVDTHMAVLPADHALATRRSLSIEDLHGERLLLFAERSLMDREEGFTHFENVAFLNSPQSVCVLTAAGLGVSVCVSHVCDFANPALSFIPIEGANMTICACYKRPNPSPEAAAFLELLRATNIVEIMQASNPRILAAPCTK